MSGILRKHIEQIIPLTDDEFAFVLSFFVPKKFKKHQFIIQEGELVRNDYFIVKGLAKAAYTDTQGKAHILQFAMEDWWISDPQAFHYQTPATLNVDCIEDTDTLSISLGNREKLCCELQKMEYFFRKKTTAGYVAMQRRILSLISTNARERYALLSNQYPQFLQRIPKTLLAAYLGISRETLSRLSPP